MSSAILCDLCCQKIAPRGAAAKIYIKQRKYCTDKFGKAEAWDVHPYCLNELMAKLNTGKELNA